MNDKYVHVNPLFLSKSEVAMAHAAALAWANEEARRLLIDPTPRPLRTWIPRTALGYGLLGGTR